MKRTDNTPLHISSPPSHSKNGAPRVRRIRGIPVLTISKSYLFWRRVKIISTIVLSAALIITIAILLRNYYVNTQTKSAVSQAAKMESKGTFENLRSADSLLGKFVDSYPSSDNVRAAHAWVLFLLAHHFGPEKEATKRAEEALDNSSYTQNGIGYAATATFELNQGNFEEATALIERGAKRYQDEPRIALVRIWALLAQGKTEMATEKIQQAISTWPDYSPFLIESTLLAIRTGNETALKKMIASLSSTIETHLWTPVAELAHHLPKWNERSPSEKRSTAILDRATSLEKSLSSVPPKVAHITNLLIGRAHLARNELDQAVSQFAGCMDQKPSASTLKWLALATMHRDRCPSALKLLAKHADLVEPGTLEIAATCELRLHHLAKSRTLIDQLDALKTSPEIVRTLRWGLQIKNGEMDAALRSKPREIREEQLYLALELYYQLKQRGRRKDIITLADSFDESLSRCARAVRIWQNQFLKRTLLTLDLTSQDACVATLASKWFWGRVSPEQVLDAAKSASRASGSNPMLEIDLARANWLVAGREKAVASLDALWETRPEGAPLRSALAEAYLEMGHPKKNLVVLKESADPFAIALRFRAQKALGKKNVDDLVKLAIQANNENPHPATAWVIAKSYYSQGKHEEVLEIVAPYLKSANQYSAELAKVASRATAAIGNRADSDRLLRDSERFVRTSAGLDEWIELKIVRARLQTNRGGQYLQKALDILMELSARRIPDAKVQLALARIRRVSGNVKRADAALFQALAMNPSLKLVYEQLKENGKTLDETQLETLKRIWPDWTP